ncbi:Hypothetical predicted protein [Mytilus galloprovincialis]|uniref:WSC domain-containing protein n=1 Tax=Mytilus galloprovincialis TaxID=29158 RepID=A0A8B6DEG3_MYTGA|nr:Hypothetical predicted protein [Mytilus galloprovincialis]
MIIHYFVLLIVSKIANSIKCQVQVIDDNDYVGCFIDSFTRLLTHQYVFDNETPDMENNFCLLYCKEQGYIYSGTENRAECHCGDDPYQYGPEDVSDYHMKDYDCNRECVGDSEQICGGGWRLSVYETGYVPYKQGQYKLVTNNTILAAPANTVLTCGSKIECARYCQMAENCKVFVISTETRECRLYNSFIVMCKEVQFAQDFQVYMMK